MMIAQGGQSMFNRSILAPQKLVRHGRRQIIKSIQEAREAETSDVPSIATSSMSPGST